MQKASKQKDLANRDCMSPFDSKTRESDQTGADSSKESNHVLRPEKANSHEVVGNYIDPKVYSKVRMSMQKRSVKKFVNTPEHRQLSQIRSDANLRKSIVKMNSVDTYDKVMDEGSELKKQQSDVTITTLQNPFIG